MKALIMALFSLLLLTGMASALNSYKVIGDVRYFDDVAIRGDTFYLHTNIKNEPETIKTFQYDGNRNPIPRSSQITRITDLDKKQIRTHKLNDLHVSAYIPDLGVYIPGKSGDLYPGERGSRTLVWEVPKDVQPGEYMMRIVVSNDDVRKVKHRYVLIE